ncbi:MAG: cytochrome c biogenesis heme-transporting ATPase CcmA [Betaproteobacteria bacterium]|nr:cytochrome c biogenesis heme-transporting ATPase CcmA [Betaproteobacteria bacterium]
MLEARQLGCTRGERTLFGDVSFTLEARGLLHVAGANGSGKTSLLRILCGLGAADGGEVCWRGEPIRELREAYWRDMVYLGHAHALKDDLTAAENLRVACEIAGRPAAHDAIQPALAQFGVAHCAQLPARALSQGQKRRSALARLALSRQARLWILDEPFSALDVAAVSQLENFILDYVEQGGSVIFTTHQDGAIAARATQKLDLDTAQVAAC